MIATIWYRVDNSELKNNMIDVVERIWNRSHDFSRGFTKPIYPFVRMFAEDGDNFVQDKTTVRIQFLDEQEYAEERMNRV